MYKRNFVVFKKNNSPVGLLYRLMFCYCAMEKSLELVTTSQESQQN